MKTLKRFLAALFLLALWAGSAPAHAALAIIVHPGNSLSGITHDEAANIYLGRTGVFANGARVTPVDQGAGSPMRKKFYSAVVKRDEAALKAYWSRLMFAGKGQPPRELGGDEAVKNWVAANPDGIGYVDGKFVDGSVKVLLIIP